MCAQGQTQAETRGEGRNTLRAGAGERIPSKEKLSLTRSESSTHNSNRSGRSTHKREKFGNTKWDQN
jgi:hypothetical protein